jgi:hypothetical protein
MMRSTSGLARPYFSLGVADDTIYDCAIFLGTCTVIQASPSTKTSFILVTCEFTPYIARVPSCVAEFSLREFCRTLCFFLIEIIPNHLE